MDHSFLDVGETVNAVANGYDTEGKHMPAPTVTWASSATGVATVSTTGVITGVAPGSTTVTASTGAITANATVNVSQAQLGAQAELSPTRLTLLKGQTAQLTAVLRDPGGVIVAPQVTTWSSSIPALASVSSSGLVTAVAPGNLVVTVTLDGHAAIAPVIVNPLPSTLLSIKVSSPDTGTIGDDSIRVLASVTPPRPLDRVEGHISFRTFVPKAIRTGPFGSQESWEAWVRMVDMANGPYWIVVSVYDITGGIASDSVAITRVPNTKNGSGTPAGGFKLVAPPPPKPAP